MLILHQLIRHVLLIHIQYNYQNTYQIKMNYKFYWVNYILCSLILILSLSKEIIIHDSFLFISPTLSFIIVTIGAVFTTPYTLKIYWTGLLSILVSSVMLDVILKLL